MKESADSKTGSNGYVLVPRAEYEKAIADIEEGNALNKKGGAAVNDAVTSLKDSAKDYRLVHYFLTADGSFSDEGFGIGLGAGLIFKNAMVAKIGVEKKNICDMSNWLEWRNAYRATASVGIVF